MNNKGETAPVKTVETPVIEGCTYPVYPYLKKEKVAASSVNYINVSIWPHYFEDINLERKVLRNMLALYWFMLLRAYSEIILTKIT